MSHHENTKWMETMKELNSRRSEKSISNAMDDRKPFKMSNKAKAKVKAYDKVLKKLNGKAESIKRGKYTSGGIPGKLF